MPAATRRRRTSPPEPPEWTPEQILAARTAAGLTQAELAVLINTTVTTVARWEIGMNKPSKYFAAELTKKLPAV